MRLFGRKQHSILCGNERILLLFKSNSKSSVMKNSIFKNKTSFPLSFELIIYFILLFNLISTFILLEWPVKFEDKKLYIRISFSFLLIFIYYIIYHILIVKNERIRDIVFPGILMMICLISMYYIIDFFNF